MCRCNYKPGRGEPMPDCCRERLLDVIRVTSRLFERRGITYWADFGTLLGLVRAGSVIPWDSDADFGVLHSQENAILNTTKRLARDGFKLVRYDEHLLQVRGQGRAYCDLWLNSIVPSSEYSPSDSGQMPEEYPAVRYDPPPKGMICQALGPGAQMDHTSDFPYWFIDQREYGRIDGVRLITPHKPRSFLRMRYGDWKTPKNKGEAYWGGNAMPLHAAMELAKTSAK